MTDIIDNGPKYPKAFYTKRYDLRPEEFSPEVDFDQYSEWQWWLPTGNPGAYGRTNGNTTSGGSYYYGGGSYAGSGGVTSSTSGEFTVRS